jgi:predicted chitinase/pyrimidine deaminase RibD-like protein
VKASDIIKEQEHLDNHKTESLNAFDSILNDLCQLVIDRQQTDSKKYGMVGACVLDNGNKVFATTTKSGKKWQHAERNAIDSYRRKYGELSKNCIIITTLSPCDSDMDDRYGSNCTDFIDSTDIKRVYCGYIDPTQKNTSSKFTLKVTKNVDIKDLCKKLAWTFLGDEHHPVNESSVLTAKHTRHIFIESQSHDYMAGHCHVMAMALKQLYPDWQIRARIGWGDDGEDEDYLVDHVYIVSPDGAAYDCRGRFENEQELVGPDETGSEETQLINYSLADIKADIARGELKKVSKQDINNATEFFQKQSIKENFADGKHPERKGDSARHGIPKGATLAQLDKIGHGSGRKAQLARWQANMKRGRAKNEDIEEDKNTDTAISLTRLGKFHHGEDELAELVPERATAQYALHPDKWESTFYSLTNKDSDKLKYYGPKQISIPTGTLVGDMAIANKFYRAKTVEEKEQYAELYRQSLKPYPVDVSNYRMPELLIPRQGVEEGWKDSAARGVIYTRPNLEREWEEANRYPEFQKLGKDAWIDIAKQGRAVNWSSLDSVGNVESDLSLLDSDKVRRATVDVQRNKVELPIVGRWPDGWLDLIGGNTRIATLLDQGHDPKVWLVDIPEVDDLEEGWKDWAAAGAIGLGGLGALSTNSTPDKDAQIDKPAIVQQAPAEQPKEKEVTTLTTNKKSEELVQRAAKAAGIEGTELAQFMAQTKHESADFSRMKEAGGSKYFTKKYDPKYAPGTAKILGNKHVGDGERYHGRGYIQITGRDNYRMAGKALGLPLEDKPELAARPDIAAKIAVWFWQTRVSPNVQNFDNIKAVTRKINPAMRGLEDRYANFIEYKKLL